jgi:hypothetical protein
MDHPVETADSIVEQLRALSDKKERLKIAGLIREPFEDGEIKQECGNCIYFLPNHRFCDLPELQVPVNADWWCRLWRV